MIGLYALHWGLVDLTINVSGLDPSSGVIEAPIKSGVITPEQGRGRVKSVSGSGGTKGISGSGGTS